MTKIVALDYDTGRALFHVRDAAVVVDINERDVVAVGDVSATALTAAGWLKVAEDLPYPAVWRELAEAAVTSLEVKETDTTDKPERKFRVPQSVKAEAQQAIDWVNGFERGSSVIGLSVAHSLVRDTYMPLSKIERISRYFSRRPQSITENAGWNNGDQGYPCDERIRYGLWGGSSCREWVSKIAEKHPIAAAGSPPSADPEVDGNAPHAFAPDPQSPVECVVCGRGVDDEIHSEQPVVAGAFEHDPTCDYFGHGIDPDTTEVDGLLMMRPDGTWAYRESNAWVDTEEPAEDEIVILLDPESAQKLADIIDDVVPEDPEVLPYELSMMNPTEAALFSAADSEIDWEMVDRVFDIYDSQERSINAQKQVRGPGGRFGSSPGSSETATPDAPKARLSQPLPLITDVAARIDAYLAEVAQQRGGGTQQPATEVPEEAAAGDPGQVTDVRPLYMAIVDTIDTQAVLDVIALVPPAAGQQGDVTCWKRHAGKWELAADILGQLRSVSPPPVVELADDALLGEVLAQVDKSTGTEEQEDTPPPGQTTEEPAKPDANPDQHPVPVQAAGHPELDMFGAGTSSKHREKYAKKGYSLPDGSFPIPDVTHLKKAIKAHGRAKNKTAAKKHITKRARALGRTDLLPEGWNKEYVADDFTLWGPNGELISFAEGGLDKNRGNAERLRRYWVRGEGAAKIGWGAPGDWYRCVSLLSKYMGTRAKGYCTLRHKDATGHWPGHEGGDKK